MAGKYPCPNCGKELSNQVSLERHIKSVHQKIRRFESDKCGKNLEEDLA